jgi:CPA2 family monovalent cation:H+ antiporter-2
MNGELNLLRDFAIIMGVALAATLPLRLLRQPPVLGYLAAGLVLGPFILPRFSVLDLETIQKLAEIGLVLLLFAIGLEFGWQRIRNIGLRVALIGVLEMTLVIAIVYQSGLSLLGLSRTEALFLGSALSISSSAVLIKVLADSGQLRTVRGQLMVGILVVEDFGAVIMLSVLSGIAAGGAADLRAAAPIALRLLLFTGAALLFGALLAPRLVALVARLRSAEALVIAGLALALGIALLGTEFGLEPAAGAFLIGAVLGDTRHSESLNRVMSPVRDMFAALFFVAIGMLVDIADLSDVVIPALILVGVVLVAKIVMNTLATFFTGSDGRTALSVGLGMPQPGEFSLAMIKVGVDHGVISAILNPIVIVLMSAMALIYPFVFRSTELVGRALERASPGLLRYYVTNLGVWLEMMRRSLVVKGLATVEIKRAARLMLVNLGIIILLLATGTVVLGFTSHLVRTTPLPEEGIGLVVSGAILALCIPPGVVLWRQTTVLAGALTKYLFERAAVSPGAWRAEDLRRLLRLTLMGSLIVVLTVWTVPLIFRLLDLGGLSGVVPVFVLLVVLLLTVRGAFRIHGVLEHTFGRTLLGPPSEAGTGSRSDHEGTDARR